MQTLISLSSKLLVSAVVVFTIIAPFEPLVAQAQDASGLTSGFNGDTSIQQIQNTSNTVNAQAQAGLNTGATQAQAQAAGVTAPSTSGTSGGTTASSPPTDNGCSLSGDWALCMSGIVYVFTVGIGSGFAYVSAYFFDIAINLSLNSAAYALTFISQGWTTARDLANMAFLFILIYIAFVIMFRADTHGTTEMLALVVVIALLVNFSFFFTRLVIDGGNILAIQFYNAIQAPSINATVAAGGVAGGVTSIVNSASNGIGTSNFANSKDLTASIMGMLNLQGLFSNSSFQSFSNTQGFLVRLISYCFLYIAAGVMLWILTVMFATAAVKFLFRIAVLWFLIIASPLAFVARAMPGKMEHYYKEWQDLLIQHAFYPVSFMFIFLMLNNFAQQVGNGSNSLFGSLFSSINTGTQAGSAGFIASIGVAIANIGIRLGFVIAVLWIGLNASQKLSVMGADVANKFGKWAGGKMVGSYGFALRQTAGRGFASLSKSPTLAQNAQQSGVAGSLWRGAYKTTKKLGDATYDIRNSKIASGLAKAADIDIGKGTEKGYSSVKKEGTEKVEKEKKERAAIIRDEANRDALRRIDADIKANRPHDNADVDRVRNLSKRELGEIKTKDLDSILHLINENQYKSIMDDENRTEEEKNGIRRISDPIIKSQKIVADDLRKLNDNLVTVQAPVVTARTARGNTIDAGNITLMQNDIAAQMQTLRANLPGAAPGVAEDIKSDMTQLRNAAKNLRELQRNTNRIVPHANKNAQEYVAY